MVGDLDMKETERQFIGQMWTFGVGKEIKKVET